MDALQPFSPSGDRAWDREAAAHLARRAGFGARGEELEELVGLGVEGAVARFVEFGERDEALERELASYGPELDTTPGAPGEYGEGPTGRLRRWWLYRMVRGRWPLEEKLTLFWHDHFATQESVVIRTPLLRAQNRMLRAHAGGSFRELLSGLARDPAMLVYLDNRLSSKENPNENWARELMELFTLGVDRYTQGDVAELARVFTGWTTPRRDAVEFQFDPEMHDSGDKQLFGERLAGRAGEAGIEEGEEALDRILARPEAAALLAEKLLKWFAHPAPPREVVAELAEVLRRAGWSIRAALRTLFGSRWFHAPEQRWALVKNPVELVVGAARAVGLENPHLAGLERYTERFGMQIFEPPSVDGWSHGAGWVGTGTVAPRFDFALELSETAHAARKVLGRATFDLDRLADLAGENPEPTRLIEALATHLIQAPLTEDQIEAAAEYLTGYGDPPTEPREVRSWCRERTRAALHLVLAAPQLTLA